MAVNEDAAKSKDADGLLPLHKAIKHNMTKKVILSLLNAYEDAAYVTDENGMLPLHKAMEMTINSEGTELQNKIGALALNKAIQCKLAEDTILHGIEANKDAAKTSNEKGLLPLQDAVKSKLPDKVILAVPIASRSVVKTKNNCNVNSAADEEKGKVLDEITCTSIEPITSDNSERDIYMAMESKLSEMLSHFSFVDSNDNSKLSAKLSFIADNLKVAYELLKTLSVTEDIEAINYAEGPPAGHSVMISERVGNEMTVVPDGSVFEEIEDSISCAETLESFSVFSTS